MHRSSLRFQQRAGMRTYPRATSPKPKKMKVGRLIMKNVCVPSEEVYTK